MAFFSHELAIDLGTANTVIFKGDEVVLDEPSIIAVETFLSLLIEQLNSSVSIFL